MQTYQSQCNQPKRKQAYFAKCGDGDKGEGQGVGGVAEASFPVADRKAGQVEHARRSAEGNCKCGCPALHPLS
jgi:hypothetical protein